MTRRTFAQLRAEGAAAERQAIVEHARRYAADVDALVARGSVNADEGRTLSRRLGAFAESVEIGLHVQAAAEDAG